MQLVKIWLGVLLLFGYEGDHCNRYNGHLRNEKLTNEYFFRIIVKFFASRTIAELRKKFGGKSEHLLGFPRMVAAPTLERVRSSDRESVSEVIPVWGNPRGANRNGQCRKTRLPLWGSFVGNYEVKRLNPYLSAMPNLVGSLTPPVMAGADR